MKTIRYKLLDDRTGVILTRTPCCSDGKEAVALDFGELAAGTVVKLDGRRGDKYFFRAGKDKLEIPLGCLGGVYSVTVTGGSEAWMCEGLNVERQDGGLIVSPDDNNLPALVALLKIDNDDIRKQIQKLSEGIAALVDKLETLTEGYDFI